MNFTFSNDLAESVNIESILISGPDSLNFTNKEYLILDSNGVTQGLFEIRYQAHCSPFKAAMIIDHILAVGFEEYFYMFDMISKSNMLKLKMEGYFGHLNFNEDLFYVADSAGIFCINKNTSIIWQTKDLGIDGVIINEFTNNKILGSGEWDPPGGWRNFILHKQTGFTIK